eukprot:CAMPEP_0201608296 /NCGR_PEP_ID=MMETSP0492-20130828/7117_1 /ASSEMBLY_ACC=CAM_ASM_000837 /TAXON_ID=420259 /ORGANISM="Thalassiosira gravida, Strain GMp14c1" /LENGTH=479 /DNA_ID=CAMNT_0048073041 /DNA_START=27 /DNA_END=1466 /DNA_ORIENTATION=+
MTASSRDIFRPRTSVSVTDNQLIDIKLTRTASLTSSDGRLSPPGSPSTPPPPQFNGSATKKELVDNMPKIERQKSNKTRRTTFSKNIKKFVTQSRKNSVSENKFQSQASPAAQDTLSKSYNGGNAYGMTSAEQDPSMFQVELPTKKEIIAHSKICALMGGYTTIHRDFDFNALSGLPHSFLEEEYEKSSEEEPLTDKFAGSCHRDVVKKLLACADDIVVEGFFREYEYTVEDNDKESERMEACVLSSDSLRQIIVCFRGSMALSKSSLSGKEPSCILHKEHTVLIMPTFGTAYFGTPIEKRVFALLANLTTHKPFFDVVITGHAFGAAMATIAGMRYASSNSQMRVSCHVFGSPRIGGEEWRQMVHSVPNLRVYRVENGSDPYVSLPSSNNWVHCGHAIQINGDGTSVEFEARRFDRRPTAAFNNKKMLGFAKTGKGKVDHQIQSYDKKLTRSGDKWFADFREVKGNGIQANNERRTLA